MDFGVPPTHWLCLAVCAVAAVTDARDTRVPNWLTYPAIVSGLAWQALLGQLPAALLGGALCFVGFLLFGLVRAVGMGDVKLMAAVGVLLGFPLCLRAVIDVLLAGGLLALTVALSRGQLGVVLRNIAARGRRVLRPGHPAPPTIAMPYALAILLGTLYAVLSAPLHLPNAL